MQTLQYFFYGNMQLGCEVSGGEICNCVARFIYMEWFPGYSHAGTEFRTDDDHPAPVDDLIQPVAGFCCAVVAAVNAGKAGG